jgi:hypothetical protein
LSGSSAGHRDFGSSTRLRDGKVEESARAGRSALGLTADSDERKAYMCVLISVASGSKETDQKLAKP